MGICCSENDFPKLNIKNELCLKKSVSRLNIAKNQRKSNEITDNKFIKKSLISSYTDITDYQKAVTSFISVFQDDKKHNEIKVDWLYLEQLWNITKYYSFNHHNSNYIIYDLRNTKNENFLKSFKSLNYTLKELSNIFETELVKIDKIKQLIMFKTLILIADKNSLSQAEQLVRLSQANNLFFKLLILKTDLNSKINIYKDLTDEEKKEKISLDVMLKQLDCLVFDFLPYILIPLKCYPEIGSNKIIFFDYFDNDNRSLILKYLMSKKASSNYLNDDINKNQSVISFIKFYRIGAVCSFTSTNKFKQYTLKNDTIKQKSLLLKSMIDLIKNIDQVIRIFNEMRAIVNKNKSFLILFDRSINKEVQVFILLICIFKITGTKPSQIHEQGYESLIYIDNIGSFMKEKKFQIEEFFNLHVYSSSNHNYSLAHQRFSSSIFTSKSPVSKFELSFKDIKHFSSNKSVNHKVGLYSYTNNKYGNDELITESDHNYDEVDGDHIKMANTDKHKKNLSMLNNQLSQNVFEGKHGNINVINSICNITNNMPSAQEPIEENENDLKLYYKSLLQKMKDDLSSYPQFILITNTILKLISNILLNPNDEKYKKIKTSSNIFITYIQSSVYCILLLESFGFEEKFIDESEDSYYLLKTKSISEIKERHDILNEALLFYLNN